MDIEQKLNTLGDCKIAVALSGGRDSVALTHALQASKAQFFAVNVEHGIRGKTSVSDSKFVAEFCRDRGINLKSYSVDAPTYSKEKGLTLEQGARELRYQIFDKLLKCGDCDYVALAHHSSDQVETVVMRILRGTGLKGLGGMSEISGRYIRPFLNFSREDIDAYIKENNLPYVDDETNGDTNFTRNFLRCEIELLKQRFPAFDDSILRLSRNACEAESYIDSKVNEPTVCGDEVYVAVSELFEIAIAKRIIIKACNKLDVFQDIEERHFALILELANCENGKRIELPHDLIVHKDRENLVFTLKNSDKTLDDCKNYDWRFKFQQYVVKYEKVDDMSKIKVGDLFVDKDKIPNTAILRHRSEGDWIEKFGGGKKSLGDFLTDRKIPLRKRDELVLLADGKEVLVVFGIEICEKLRVDKSTKDIAKISLENKA